MKADTPLGVLHKHAGRGIPRQDRLFLAAKVGATDSTPGALWDVASGEALSSGKLGFESSLCAVPTQSGCLPSLFPSLG